MVIEYANTLDDMAEFTRFHFMNSPSGRRTLRTTMIMMASAYLVAVTWTVRSTLREVGPLVSAVIMGVVILIAIVMVLTYRAYLVRRMLVSSRRFYAEGKNKGTVGWHRLTITDRSLREESAGGSQESHFDVIERIEETSTHALVYTSAAMAHVVPKQAVSAGDLAAFLTELRRRVQIAA